MEWLLIAYVSGHLSWSSPFTDLAACEAKVKELKWMVAALAQGTRVSVGEFEYKCVNRSETVQ